MTQRLKNIGSFIFPGNPAGPRIAWYWQLGLPLLFVLLTRLPYFGIQILNSDEGLYSCVARAMQQGGLPYRDAWDHAAPGVFYLFFFIFKIGGAWNMGLVRLTALIAHLFAVLIIGAEVRRRYGDLTGMLTACLAAVAIGGYLPGDSVAAITEIFLLPALLGFSWIIFHWMEIDQLNKPLAAFLLALATWFKIHALLISFFILAGAVFSRHKSGKELFPTLKSAISLLLLSAPFYLLMVLHLFIKGGFYDFMEVYISYNLFYMGAGAYDAVFIEGLWKTAWQWGLPQSLTVAAAAGGIFTLMKGDQQLKNRGWIFIFAIAGSLLVAVTGARLFGHYFLPAAAFTAWSGASGLHLFSNKFIQKDKLAMTPGLLLAGILLTGGLLQPVVYFHGEAYSARQKLAKQNKRISSPIPNLEKSIQHYTRPDEKIWVWGFAPEIYVYTQRDCSSRFIKADYLVGLVPWVNAAPEVDTTPWIIEGSWQKLQEDMMEEPPAAIVDCAIANYQFYGKYPIKGNQSFWKFINTSYVSAKRPDGFGLYIRKDIAKREGLLLPQSKTPEVE